MYEIFKRLCEEKSVTPYKVGKETGIARSTLSDWKNGKSIPKQGKLQKIADFFEVSVDYLMTGKTNKFSSEMAAIDLELADMPLEMKKYALKLAALPEEKQKQIMSLIDMLEN